MKQFSRFIMVGVFNTLFGYCIIFACMYLARMSPEASNMAGYTIGLIVSYILNRNFTFNSKQSRTTEIIRFLAVFVVAYSSNFAILVILIHKVGQHEGISQISAGIVYVLVSYLMNKYYVFKPADARKPRLAGFPGNYSIYRYTPLYKKSILADLSMHLIFNKFRSCVAYLVQINTRSAISGKEYIIVLGFIIGLFLFLLGPALQAKFYIIEDHLLPESISRDFIGWATHIKNDITTYARVRPVYWIYVAMGNLLFGTNPHLWHAATMLWGVLTSYLLYISIRKLGADVASSVIFILLLVSVTHGWIWVSLIPQETTGMGMAAIAVWAIILASRRNHVNRLNILSLAAMALAGLIKESVVILIPALLLLRITCEKLFNNDVSWRECFHSLRGWILTGILIFTIEIMLVLTVLLTNPGGYSAGVSNFSLASFDPRKWFKLLSMLGLNELLVLVTGVWVGLWFTKKYDRKILIAIALILVAWLIPQVVLYINGLNDRYLFPGIVGIAVWVSLGLSVLCTRFWWPILLFGLTLLLPVLTNGITSTVTHVSSFTAETQVSNRMIEFIAQNIPSDKTILMAGDSGTPYGFEATYSLPVYLRLAGSKSPFYLWPLLAKGERTEMHILASKNNTAFRYPDALTTNDIGAIIIVDRFTPGLDYKPLSQWLGDTSWREVKFTVPYYTFSFNDLKYMEAGKHNYKILLSASLID